MKNFFFLWSVFVEISCPSFQNSHILKTVWTSFILIVFISVHKTLITSPFIYIVLIYRLFSGLDTLLDHSPKEKQQTKVEVRMPYIRDSGFIYLVA
jgi:steroid 5-alpha reductase family enzyme